MTTWESRQINRLMQMYRLGHSAEKIGKSVVKSRSAVEHKIAELKKLGKLKPRPVIKKQWTDEERMEVIRLRTECVPIAEIAKKMGLKPGQVIGIWHRHMDSHPEPQKPIVCDGTWPVSYLGQDVDELTLKREKLGPVPRLEHGTSWGVAEYGGM